MRPIEAVEVKAAQTDSEFAVARGLIERYAEALGVDLCFQNYAHEISHLREVYGPPRGCLLVAYQASEAVGCVALRGLDEGVCEMKRLYVNPDLRRSGTGRLLVRSIVDRARSIGYRRMVLDTLSSMEAALTLYRSFGFHETGAYYANPLPTATYMALDLDLAGIAEP